MGKPSMDQKFECVSVVNEALPLALGRIYVQHILPAGYKVGPDHHIIECSENMDSSFYITEKICKGGIAIFSYLASQSAQMTNIHYVTGSR